MVHQRILQEIRRIRILPIFVSAAVALPSVSRAQTVDADTGDSEASAFAVADTFVIDLRPGSDRVRAPSREAFIDALGEHGELRLAGDLELRMTLARAPYSAILEQGKVSLASAAVAYGSLDCPGTRERTEGAILDLAAAQASGAAAEAELRQAYLYRFLCAHRASEHDEAMAAAHHLRTLGANDERPDGRPPEISELTWNAYPEVDAVSNESLVPVEIESEPRGVSLWLDFEERGTTPSKVFLPKGEHVVAMGSEDGAVSQRITVSGPGKVKLALHRSKRAWRGVSDSLLALQKARGRERQESMRDLMAAIEGRVAFVMREPGRISVWVLPPRRRMARHVGHAPNASIAGRLAIDALQQSSRAPGLDPTMPLLTEDSETTSRARSNRGWWIAGVIAGAAAVGAGLIIAQDLQEDRQRIEVTLP